MPGNLGGLGEGGFGRSPGDAAKWVAELKIFYPYGWVGPLGWEGRDTTADFGASNYDLNNVANRIKTYNEDPDGASIDEIRNAIDRAQAIIVLGFGFHRQNIDLLNATNPSGMNKHLFMTAHGIDEENHEGIKERMRMTLKVNHRIHVRMTQDKCGDFF